MAKTEGSWLRLIVEKPFGFDLQTSEELAGQLGQLFPGVRSNLGQDLNCSDP